MSPANNPITHRTVWVLAGPIILSNLSVPLVGAVDTAVVGHLPGPQYIGAVALGALIFSFLYWGFGFLRMGTTGFVARSFGAGDSDELQRILLRSLLLGLFFGVLVILFSWPLIRLALVVVDASTRVEVLAQEYALIRVWSAPATLCVYVFTGIFIGLHNTRRVFILQLVLNSTNIVLDLLFVPVLEFGVAGVAWATLIAEYTAALCGLWLLRNEIRAAITSVSIPEVLERSAMLSMMRTNSQIFVRTLCLVFSFAFFTAQSARYGEVVLAANTVLLHFFTFMAYGLDGFAHAVEALGGSAYGAGNRERFRRAVRLTTLWSVITALFASLGYFLFGEVMLGWFTRVDEVIATASQYLVWMVIAPVLSCFSFQMDGLFIGTGHTREMRNAMLISTLGYLLLAFIFQSFWGNHGLFLALYCFMLLRAVTLYYHYPKVVLSAGDLRDSGNLASRTP